MNEVEALFLSAFIEAPIAFLVVRYTQWPSRGAGHAAAAAAVATAVTHPQLWATALWAYARFGFWPSIVTLEIIVVWVEALLIAWMADLRIDRALGVSFAANAGSFAVGLLVG